MLVDVLLYEYVPYPLLYDWQLLIIPPVVPLKYIPTLDSL